jgi:DNA-directed RNA polymerase subunit alpha
MPIKKVNYKVKLIHDTKGNIKESLNLEVITNGSITPKRAIQEALKVIMNLIYTLFITPEFVQISKKTIK